MNIIPVALKENSYKIVVGSKILLQLGQTLRKLKIGDDAVVVTNPLIQKKHGPPLTSGLKAAGLSVKFFPVPAGEQSKSNRVAFDLIDKISCYDVKRKIFIMAFGGGVVGDLAGYVASVYKRGVPYVQVPTTLLAQIDSAIGGKVGIDLPTGKNLVGAIYQPKIVWSDVSVLSTLNDRQIRNGLAEAVKYGIISDKKLFDYIEKNHTQLLSKHNGALQYLVLACSRIKACVVALDEKETKGVRTILNFGHTLGHAIEAAGSYADYHHGEAVALGMRVAVEISRQLGYLKKTDVLRINRLLSAIGLPRTIKKVKLTSILKAMAHDKKFKAKKNRFVLATRVGQVKVVEGIPESVIRKSLSAYF